MFERSNQATREAFDLARVEAQGLGQREVLPEHVLLGILQVPGRAAHVLENHGVIVEAVRHWISRFVPVSDHVEGEVPSSWLTLALYDQTLREALALQHFEVRTEHVLLAMIRLEGGAPFRILVDFDIDPEDVRNELYRLMNVPSRQ